MPGRGYFLGWLMTTNSREELIPRLEDLYRRMDHAYSTAAAATGFTCQGCDGAKCCTVDLVLHTLAERLYLRRGFNALDPEAQGRILARSTAMVTEKDRDPSGEGYRGLVCVLNEGGLCLLYEFRPMICRLAGIAHTFSRPDGRSISGDGCMFFEMDVRPVHPTASIDRTPLYREMAELETETLTLFRRSRPRPCTIAELLARGLK